MTPLMACGHAAQGTSQDGQPVCAICVGLHPGATVAAETPDLTGRFARCFCGRLAPSDTSLAFFGFRGGEFDTWYCGCRGLD